MIDDIVVSMMVGEDDVGPIVVGTMVVGEDDDDDDDDEDDDACVDECVGP